MTPAQEAQFEQVCALPAHVKSVTYPVADLKALQAEFTRWQDAIREELIRLSGAPDRAIDGGGCDSGDPLDFTLTEIRQAFAWRADNS